MTRRTLLAGTVLPVRAAVRSSGKQVTVGRVPGGGIQPQACVDGKGTVHLVSYCGRAPHGDLFYVRSADEGATFSSALRVNSQPRSAIATGTIRGGQMALGEGGQVHVAWNGSSLAEPKGPVNPDSGKEGAPMLYARLDGAGSAFEAQRNLMHLGFGLDGGGSVAADHFGDVYVGWHARVPDSAHGEAGRSVWIARSGDKGTIFSREKQAWSKPTGACGCCSMRLFADNRGTLYGLYRSATENVHRDIYLLVSTDRGKTFRGELLHRWKIGACPMSSMSMAQAPLDVLASWETAGQVYWTRIRPGTLKFSTPIPAPGTGKGRKHPAIAANTAGETILVWTEGTGWQRGGSLAWQVFDRGGRPTAESGTAPGVPVWSFGTVFARSDCGFTILY